MSRTLTEAQALQQSLHRLGTARKINEDDLDEVELDEDDEKTIYRDQVPTDGLFAHGAGTDDRGRGRSSFIHCHLKNSAGETLEGELWGVVTDSRERDVIARYYIGDLGDLADAANDDRTDRPMQPVVGPPASEDRYLQLRVIADSDANGETIDTNESDVRLYYTDIPL